MTTTQIPSPLDCPDCTVHTATSDGQLRTGSQLQKGVMMT